MTNPIENWRTQVRKGYLELCILLLIQKNEQVYGFQLLELLDEIKMPLKEGTLYPMLNRMSKEGVLKTHWETENIKGHPRKFYALTKQGTEHLDDMKTEFEKMIKTYKSAQK